MIGFYWDILRTFVGGSVSVLNSVNFRVTTQYNDLETDEINILTGALRLKQKCVKVG